VRAYQGEQVRAKFREKEDRQVIKSFQELNLDMVNNWAKQQSHSKLRLDKMVPDHQRIHSPIKYGRGNFVDSLPKGGKLILSPRKRKAKEKADLTRVDEEREMLHTQPCPG
jgi:hypothetical protein